jgi:hypothetical protein
VGTVVVRFVLPEVNQLQISTSYLSLLSDSKLVKTDDEIALQVPEIKFKSINIQPVKLVARKAAAVTPVRMDKELHFEETIKVPKVIIASDLETNLVALYEDFSFDEEKKMMAEAAPAETIKDEVSVKLAAETAVDETEFFDYPKAAQKSEQKSSPGGEENIETANVDDLLVPNQQVSQKSVVESEPEFFDYPEKVNSQKQVVREAPQTAAVPVSFDVQKAEVDLQQKVIPTVSSVSSHKTPPKGPSDYSKAQEVSAIKAFESYPSSLSIRALGTNLAMMEDLKGFEVRFQDNLSETIEDFGAGEIKFDAQLAQSKMTRSAVILKRGYIPTSTELILEEGSGSISVPLIEEDVLNDLVLEFEKRGSVGSLLIELDDETEVAKIDVPFGKVLKLNGDLKPTEGEDFRYELFVGVRTGNSMVSYHRNNGEIVNKIVHIHENELTFDANFYENVVNEKVRLYEEDLLAKESSPLIIAEDQVKVFATNEKAKKVNNHTYKLNFNSSSLGGRRYIELNHQSEPVFVGLRENSTVTVPSENFMRFILSKVEGGKLGNRCLVQINLPKNASRYEVASESAGSGLVTYAQVLDRDGKFYDSLSDKSQKVIIIGEGQASGNVSQDAKINVKIEFQDGTLQYLSSYCSPNTYLVEQL